MQKLFVVVLLAGAAYFVTAYWPVGKAYFAVRYAAQKIANQRLQTYSERRDAIHRALADVEHETGLVIFTSAVDYELDDDGRPQVSIEVSIPVRFPFLNTQNEHAFTITASSSHRYGAVQ